MAINWTALTTGLCLLVIAGIEFYGNVVILPVVYKNGGTAVKVTKSRLSYLLMCLSVVLLIAAYIISDTAFVVMLVVCLVFVLRRFSQINYLLTDQVINSKLKGPAGFFDTITLWEIGADVVAAGAILGVYWWTQ